MNFGFVVNDLATEHPEYTTPRLAMAANRRGHQVWMMGVGDLAHDPDGAVSGHARGPKKKKAYRSPGSLLADIQSEEGEASRVDVSELDVLMLRNDPAGDAMDRPWAQTSGVLFGQLAAAAGVIVLNDPIHLADAINKTYFQHFPESARPRTLISRDAGDIRAFIEDMGGRAVLKPLQGSGGQGVFLVSGKQKQNVNQIVETITRDGYVVAQEYLTEASDGDIRLFVMNGEPLMVDGRYAAFRRVNKSDDPRSNMHVGGEARPVKITDEILELVDLVRPKLVANGMFLVGLDIVGSKLMEANVFSPGGLSTAGKMHEVNFAAAVVEAMEHKVELRRNYGPRLSNTAVNTL